MMNLVNYPVTIAEEHLENIKDSVKTNVYELTMNGLGNHIVITELKLYFNK